MKRNCKRIQGRPQVRRYVNSIPTIKGLKPFGIEGDIDNQKNLEPVLLNIEEYEAIRLSDYENYNQCDSATIMGVSRPTFTRIYKRARQKVAKAMVEARSIIVKGGNIVLNDGWYECNECQAIFELNYNKEAKCALCSSPSIKPYE